MKRHQTDHRQLVRHFDRLRAGLIEPVYETAFAVMALINRGHAPSTGSGQAGITVQF